MTFQWPLGLHQACHCDSSLNVWYQVVWTLGPLSSTPCRAKSGCPSQGASRQEGTPGARGKAPEETLGQGSGGHQGWALQDTAAVTLVIVVVA